MKILIACEESQRVCIAFREMGHEAYSCDIKDCTGGHPEWHIKGDAIKEAYSGKYDMMIAHPPCTYLSVSGLHWNGRIPGRAEKTEKGLAFVQKLMDAPIEKIVIENPISCISTRIKKPDQIIQPYEFKEDASKRTCLWLKNVQSIIGTGYYLPRIVNGKKRWGNQTDSGQNKLGPSENRASERSKTYWGIARAMAAQWGKAHDN